MPSSKWPTCFCSPSSIDKPDKTVLIMDSNPFTMVKEFHPDAFYRINIDNDGDGLADVALAFVFSEPNESGQTGTAYYAVGDGGAEKRSS